MMVSLASVLIPTRNPGPGIERVLRAVFAQESEFAFEVIVVDSGSTDTELDAMHCFPITVHQIPPEVFGHGRTRNLLAQKARGDVLLYLSQDAEPSSRDWMSTLVAPLADAGVAGAYARHIPRPNSDPLMRYFLLQTYGETGERRRMRPDRPLGIRDMFFSNVSSAIRRDVWEQIPFRPDITMSEDQYWAHDVLRAGYEVVYEPAAQVYHSHSYSLRALWHRYWQSGASLRGLIADSPGGIAGRGLNYVLDEARYLLRERRTHLLPYLLLYEATKALSFSLGMSLGRANTRLLK